MVRNLAFVRSLVLALASLSLLIATPTLAQSASAPDMPEISVTFGNLHGAEAEDARLLEQAMQAMQTSGYSALERLAPRLRRALDRAPSDYPAARLEGNVIHVRGDTEEAILISTMVMAANRRPDAPRHYEVSITPNVYPLISLLLGALAVEKGQYDEALRVMDRGRAIQPGYPLLEGERIVALQGLGRHEDAIAAANAALESGNALVFFDPGLLLRRRGTSEIELNRLDEAEASYTEALEADEEDAISRAQLDYIRQLRAGGPRRQLVFPNGTNPSP